MINKESLLPYVMFSKPIQYRDKIILYPITMQEILSFRLFADSITVRKNSTFRDKKIIKMTYLDFLLYCYGNTELEQEYKIVGLSNYYYCAIQLLKMCCKDSIVTISQETGQIYINGELITPDIFDDLRRIIIIQNDIDFDIDEFLNYDTEQSLLKAQKKSRKNQDEANIEDYIDSLVVAMHVTEDYISNMTIRKFWRYVERYNLHENYTIMRTGECSGMVTFKEPIKHWMCSIDKHDKYESLKTDEQTLGNKIKGANS